MIASDVISTMQQEVETTEIQQEGAENTPSQALGGGSAISVFVKEKIHSLFRSLQRKRIGILGIASPLCMYGTIPLAASFPKNGIKDDWLAAFMLTGPATKITNLGAL